jgi:hypothetical protein
MSKVKYLIYSATDDKENTSRKGQNSHIGCFIMGGIIEHCSCFDVTENLIL